LKKKEEKIMVEVESIMQTLMSNKKYMSQLSKIGSQAGGPYELDGRVVVAVRSKEIASKLGVFRGNSSQGSSIFVEPKEIVKLGNELESIRDEITLVENQILNHFSTIVTHAATSINKGLDAVAKVDTIFARAAFGSMINGCIPHVGDDGGVIKVEKFVHPVLSIHDQSTVPIDLIIANNPHQRSLIISGPNAGGKTLAMKSFGLVAIMNRVAIPIPTDSRNPNKRNDIRIDFFQNIFVKIGDDQNVLQGESTYMAQLNTLSRIVNKISTSESNSISDYSLILLDELGDGTDPEEAGCIAQAILEKILDSNLSRTISTTHSSRLKTLSLSDERFTAASVLLQGGNSNKYKVPTYKLSYGTSGQSYALGAAARVTPDFPDDLLDRAANLISSSEEAQGEQIRTITEALEKEREAAYFSTEKAEEYERQIKQCRDAMIHVTKAYDQHLSRLEDRLDSVFTVLNDDQTKDAYDVVGESMATLRLMKKQIKTKEEILNEKGL
jgi:DNA mismatch repair protein MutS2